MCLQVGFWARKPSFAGAEGRQKRWHSLKACCPLGEQRRRGGGEHGPCLAVSLLLLWPSSLCAAKGDPVRVFFLLQSLFVSYRHTHTQLFSQVLGGKLGRKKAEGMLVCGMQLCVRWRGDCAQGGCDCNRGDRRAIALTPEEKTTEPLWFSGTCWQLSEGCHSFLCRVTRTGWNWFEADQLLNTMQSLSYYSGIASSLHGSQKQRILQKDTIP